MKPLLKKLGLVESLPRDPAYEARLGELIALERGLASLEAAALDQETLKERSAPLKARAALLLEAQSSGREDTLRTLRDAQLAGLREALAIGRISEGSYNALREQVLIQYVPEEDTAR